MLNDGIPHEDQSGIDFLLSSRSLSQDCWTPINKSETRNHEANERKQCP